MESTNFVGCEVKVSSASNMTVVRDVDTRDLLPGAASSGSESGLTISRKRSGCETKVDSDDNVVIACRASAPISTSAGADCGQSPGLSRTGGCESDQRENTEYESIKSDTASECDDSVKLRQRDFPTSHIANASHACGDGKTHCGTSIGHSIKHVLNPEYVAKAIAREKLRSTTTSESSRASSVVNHRHRTSQAQRRRERREHKTRNNNIIGQELVGQIQALQGDRDARIESDRDAQESVDDEEDDQKSVKAGPPAGPVAHDVDVHLPYLFTVEDTIDSWRRWLWTRILMIFDGITETWVTQHRWRAARIQEFVQDGVIRVYDDETDSWEERPKYIAKSVPFGVKGNEITVNYVPEVADDERVVMSRGFDLLRKRPQIVDYEVSAITRGARWWVLPTIHSYVFHVCGSVAADVSTFEGFDLTGDGDRERLDVRYMTASRSTNIPYFKTPEVRTHTVQFLLDYLAHLRVRDGFSLNTRDFQENPVTR